MRLVVTLLLASGSVIADQPKDDAVREEIGVTDRLVLAYHYPWYGYKQPKNWDRQPALVDHPLLGPYCSADPELIEFQLSLAEEAGIDAFIVSWSDADSIPGKIFEQMLDQLGKSPHGGFRLCLILEVVANMPEISQQKLQGAIALVLQRYGRHPAYLRVDGKPVLFVYTPHHKSVGRWRTIRRSVTRGCGAAWYIAVPDGWDMDLEYLRVFDGIVPYADKYCPDAVLAKNYDRVAEQVRAAGKPVTVAAIGGGGRHQKLGFDIDRTKGQYLRRRFQIARNLDASWVVLTCWNEWYEGNQVEPSLEYGFEQIRYVREMSGVFKGTAPLPLEGASLSASESRSSTKTELSVTNTGRRTVYCVTAVGSRKCRPIIAYLLRPGESTTIPREDSYDEVFGFLPDGSTVHAARARENRSTPTHRSPLPYGNAPD